MILKFAECIYIEDPTFITGFNDSSFDWPFILRKIEYWGDPDFYDNYRSGHPKTKFLTEFATKVQGAVIVRGRRDKQSGFTIYTESKNLFRSSDVKITASNTRKGLGLDIAGIICIDTRTLLMKD
jgi:DNA polymerase elongation subunit (family B)